MSPRKQTTEMPGEPRGIPATVYYRGRRVASVQGRRLFACGMELAPSTATRLNLELSPRGRAWVLPAEVVHRDGALIGVVFRGLQLDLIRELARSRGAALDRIPGETALGPSPDEGRRPS